MVRFEPALRNSQSVATTAKPLTSTWWGDQPVNNAALVTFRWIFGLLMMLESFGVFVTGWIDRVYLHPQVTFTMFTVEWPYAELSSIATPWFLLMGCASCAVMLGWHYRLSTVLLAVLWTGAYLGQKSSYNNHYYLAMLVCWIMACLPAHRRASFDAPQKVDHLVHCPAWIPFAYKIQIALVFGYAALAKLDSGWRSGEFLSIAFEAKANMPVLGPLLSASWFPVTLASSGLIFDALIIPALWWKKTRSLAMIGLILFNLFNSVVFQIGIFPYLVLGWTIFFWEPSTVERVFRWLPGLKTASGLSPILSPTPIGTKLILYAYLVIQLLLPLRHHLIAGNVAWTEEGHRMSWRMMLRTKSGYIRLRVKDPETNESWIIDLSKWLSEKQQHRVAVMPDLTYQFVQVLKDHYGDQGRNHIQIYAEKSRVRLNSGDYHPMIDPTVDLTTVSFSYWRHNKWILHLPTKKHRSKLES